MTKVKGSARLGQWIASAKTKVLVRLDKSKRHKDAVIVMELIASKQVIAIITRRHKDSYRNGAKSMTEARRTGEETWPADGHLLRKAKRFNPHKAVVYLVDTDDYWICDFDKWFDPKVRLSRRASVSGDEIFHMPSSQMVHVPRFESLRKV